MQPDVPGAGRVPIAVLRPRLSDQSPGRVRDVQLPVRLVLSREVRAVSAQAGGARVQLGGGDDKGYDKDFAFRSAYRKVLHDPLRRDPPMAPFSNGRDGIRVVDRASTTPRIILFFFCFV